MRLLVVNCCQYHAPGRASPWHARVTASTGFAASNKLTPHSGTPGALVCTWLLVRGAAIMNAPPRTQPSGAPPQTQPGSAQPGAPRQAGPARVHLYPTPIPGRQPGRALSYLQALCSLQHWAVIHHAGSSPSNAPVMLAVCDAQCIGELNSSSLLLGAYTCSDMHQTPH